MASSSYDPNQIIQAAQEKAASNDFAGGQMVFQSALLDWVDDARETTAGNADTIQEAVATLWLAYAQYQAENKQFKSATETYEQAVQCPVGSLVGRVWLEYARFAEDRGKLRTAQDVYIRALVGKDGVPAPVKDEQDQTLLWQEFLEMMRKTNPDLTLSALQAAVEEPPTKKIKLEEGSAPAPALLTPAVATQSAVESRTHVILPEVVQTEAKSFVETMNLENNNLPPDLFAGWMLRDGNSPPQPPEPLFQPSPPKLSDPVCTRHTIGLAV